jgi:ferrous iron transport protein A
MKPRPHFRKFFSRHHTTINQKGEVPLCTLRTGEKGVVARIAGGRGMLERMTSLGFVPGTEVYILQNFRHGPLLVQAHHTRIALGRGIAARIQIRRSEA